MNTIRQREHGGIMIMFALMIVVLTGFAGLAIDAGIGYGVKAKLNAAVDAAAIAASRAVSYGANDEERRSAAIAAGQNFYYANFPDDYLGATAGTPTVVADHLSNGSWKVSVSGSASVPTHLMRVFGVTTMDVSAVGEAVRRDLDMILVLDTSGSLSSVFGTVKSSAINFVNRFNGDAGGDRLGLVLFSSNARVAIPINKTAARGFAKNTVISTINSQSSDGWTASAEAMRLALNDLNAVPESLRSSLRVIVFFSDGAPNTVGARYERTSGGSFSGTISSGTDGSVGRICTNYNECEGYTYSGSRLQTTTLRDISVLPVNNGTAFGSLPLSSYNNKRTFSPALGANSSMTACNTNKAARNMVENIANTARTNKIFVFTLGLGNQLNSIEMRNCSYGNSEYGANILKRIANTNTADTYNNLQPTGTYVYAANATELDAAFNKIASEIIRLSR